ncbi:hypothetical protein BXZ70DRAFT_486855 [Cristinia sonorae]|uniref:Uncharacterized protein n=1 Tax=Cristinia sonorae TaxID=1940300 RepID=A0A8K0UH37_9AGAR|nr:hypothetical protein BXZ70DRAFT_486855 [Cristinia sonorae]
MHPLLTLLFPRTIVCRFSLSGSIFRPVDTFLQHFPASSPLFLCSCTPSRSLFLLVWIPSSSKLYSWSFIYTNPECGSRLDYPAKSELLSPLGTMVGCLRTDFETKWTHRTTSY